MRRLLLTTILFLAAITSVYADEMSAADVAVLNVDRVFKAYAPLQERMAPIVSRARELDKSGQLKQIELEERQRELSRMPPAHPKFVEASSIVARLQAELRVFTERERRNLQKEELEVRTTVYREMEGVVQELCQTRKIKLVLRQHVGSPTSETTEEVVAWLNRPVIFDDNLDITDDVIAAMNNLDKKEK